MRALTSSSWAFSQSRSAGVRVTLMRTERPWERRPWRRTGCGRYEWPYMALLVIGWLCKGSARSQRRAMKMRRLSRSDGSL